MDIKHLPHQIIAKKELFSDLFNLVPFSSHIKDATSGKYLAMNQASLELLGFSTANEIIGLTVNDLAIQRSGCWDKTFPDYVIDLDHQAITSHNTAMIQHSFLNNQGFVRIEKLVKIPILNEKKNKTIGLLSFGEDLTFNVNLLFLFNNYKKFYLNKNEMILKFLQFLKIDQFFLILPTQTELRLLLAMKLNDSYKFLAKSLNISIKTVESHRNNLKEKVSVNLLHLALILRNGMVNNE